METKDKRELPEFGHYIDVNGLQMYYEDRGKGTPLILLHGGLGTAELGWAGLREVFSQQALLVVVMVQHGAWHGPKPHELDEVRLVVHDKSDVLPDGLFVMMLEKKD